MNPTTHNHSGFTANKSSARVVELDALRGLAAFAVVLYHYTTQYSATYGHITAPILKFPAGNYGVQLFFLISGFVIFMTLEKTKTGMDFVVSRFSRLYPAYWASVCITAAFAYTIGLPDQRLPLTSLLVNFTMFQEALYVRHLDGAYWTLQVELFFYLQMLAWFYLGQLSRIRLIIVGWLVAAMVYSYWMEHNFHLSWTVEQFFILRHIPFFAIGILFYRIHSSQHKSLVDFALVAACLAVVAITLEPVFAVVALCCTIIFFLFVFNKLRWLAAQPFVFLGSISYSLYLLHQVIGFDLIWHLEHRFNMNGTVSVALAIGMSIILATGVTRWIEQPAMRWIRDSWRNYKAKKSSARQAEST